MNFPSPLSCKGLRSPRKQTQDHLHFWQARRRDRRMLDKALIRGFYEPELVHARRCFHSLESLKTPKKTPGGAFSSNLVSRGRKSIKQTTEELT